MRKKQKDTYYKTCPDCGANLDPQERCDCKDTHEPIINTKSSKEETAA